MFFSPDPALQYTLFVGAEKIAGYYVRFNFVFLALLVLVVCCCLKKGEDLFLLQNVGLERRCTGEEWSPFAWVPLLRGGKSALMCLGFVVSQSVIVSRTSCLFCGAECVVCVVVVCVIIIMFIIIIIIIIINIIYSSQ